MNIIIINNKFYLKLDYYVLQNSSTDYDCHVVRHSVFG